MLRGNKLVSFSNTMVEAGSYTLSSAGVRLSVDQSDALVFSLDSTTAHGMAVTTVPLALANAPEPGQRINPQGLAYTPDALFLDRDNNVLLFCRAQLSLFRWSTAERRYLTSLSLAGVPELAAYSADTHMADFCLCRRHDPQDGPALIQSP